MLVYLCVDACNWIKLADTLTGHESVGLIFTKSPSTMNGLTQKRKRKLLLVLSVIMLRRET